MNKSTIGVVVPTLNGSATLEWTLFALCHQKDVALEIVVADSGSTDTTLKICKKWEVPTIYVPPGNMYRAINAALGRMETEWVTYLCSDDLVYSDSYARLVSHGERQRASLVYGDGDFIDSEGRFLFGLKSAAPARLRRLLEGGRMGFIQPAAIYRRSVFKELGGFDEQYRLIADYDFFFRLISSAFPVAKLEGPAVAAFRRHPLQLSSQQATDMMEELRTFRKSGKVRTSPRSCFDLLCWCLQNSSNYLWRFMSGRAWPPKLFREVPAQKVHEAVH